MKNTLKRKLMFMAARAMTVACVGSATMMTAYASPAESNTDSEATLEDVTSPIIDLLKNVLNVLIPLVAAVGAIFCISLGLKYSRAEEPQEREKAKQHLKSAIIGFGLIFVLIVALRLATPVLTNWMEDSAPKN